MFRSARTRKSEAADARPVGPTSRPRRLNYANVTASIALFAALGGTSYAAIKLPAKSVGSIQIKTSAVTKSKIAAGAVDATKVRNGAITGADIAAGAVDGSKVRDGSLSAADIAGKVPTAATADGLAQIHRATVAAANDPAPANSFSVKAVSAECPAGTFVVGGGASLSDQNAQFVNDSYPSSATSWTADVANGAPTSPTFTVYAICVAATAGS